MRHAIDSNEGSSVSMIESPDYEVIRQRLMKDPIVIAMAKGLEGEDLSEMVHNPNLDDPFNPNPTPRFEFMLAANKEYRKRGGKDGGHIGAIAEVLLRLVKDA
jgi:hypothetical protein